MTNIEVLKKTVDAAISFYELDPFTESLIAGGFHGFKDISCALMEIAERTGYDYNYLCEVFEESDHDEPVEEVIASICESALEFDL